MKEKDFIKLKVVCAKKVRFQIESKETNYNSFLAKNIL